MLLCAAPGRIEAVPGPSRPAADIVLLEDHRVLRKVTYKMRLKRNVEPLLWENLRLHQSLYNAALQERIEAYRKAGKTVGFVEQCKSLTQLRADLPEYAALNAQSCQVTLKRLDRAFQTFFRRVKAGETPGFPRFKGLHRYPGWGYKSHGDGFLFEPGLNWRHGRVRLSGIGWIALRGEARTPGEVVCAEVLRKADGWYLSVTLKCEPHREVDEDRTAMSFDWGVEHWMTWCEEDRDGLFHAGDIMAAQVGHITNPRFERKFAVRLAELQQDLARKVKGSRGWRNVKRQIGALMKKVADCRKDFRDQTCAELVRKHHTIVTEGLNVKNMTASARGTVEEPGSNVQQKAGLNRSILDGSPGGLLRRLETVAEEAGTLLAVLETRIEAPSQHCPKCGARRLKGLDERVHLCAECCHRETRDGASARWMLGRFYGVAPRPAWKGPGARGRVEPSPPREPKRETAARAVRLGGR